MTDRASQSIQAYAIATANVSRVSQFQATSNQIQQAGPASAAESRKAAFVAVCPSEKASTTGTGTGPGFGTMVFLLVDRVRTVLHAIVQPDQYVYLLLALSFDPKNHAIHLEQVWVKENSDLVEPISMKTQIANAWPAAHAPAPALGYHPPVSNKGDIILATSISFFQMKTVCETDTWNTTKSDIGDVLLAVQLRHQTRSFTERFETSCDMTTSTALHGLKFLTLRKRGVKVAWIAYIAVPDISDQHTRDAIGTCSAFSQFLLSAQHSANEQQSAQRSAQWTSPGVLSQGDPKGDAMSRSDFAIARESASTDVAMYAWAYSSIVTPSGSPLLRTSDLLKALAVYALKHNVVCVAFKPRSGCDDLYTLPSHHDSGTPNKEESYMQFWKLPSRNMAVSTTDKRRNDMFHHYFNYRDPASTELFWVNHERGASFQY